MKMMMMMMMMMSSTTARLNLSIFLILLLLQVSDVHSFVRKCGQEEDAKCIDKKKAMPLKIIAIVSILITSMIGIGLPLLTHSIPAFNPNTDLFTIVKSFSSGIILATGYMHVLPDSFYMLSSGCLDDNPWHKFPFTGLIAMLSCIATLIIDSMATSIYSKKKQLEAGLVQSGRVSRELQTATDESKMDVAARSQLLRHRIIAMFLELGIIVHSVVIGLSLGASNSTCTIKGLVAALCFHQMFEGIGLGGCILQAEYKWLKKATMAFLFSVTTPLGIAIGIAISSSYRQDSPHSLVTVGLLNATSAGLLIYMAMVDLLAADFLGPKLQQSIKLQIKSYAALLFGAGAMSLMAKWA